MIDVRKSRVIDALSRGTMSGYGTPGNQYPFTTIFPKVKYKQLENRIIAVWFFNYARSRNFINKTVVTTDKP